MNQNSKYSCDNEIDYNKSRHTKAVQRSRYIQLDGDLGSDNSDDARETRAAGYSERTYKEILGYKDTEDDQNTNGTASKKTKKAEKSQSNKPVSICYVKPE